MTKADSRTVRCTVLNVKRFAMKRRVERILSACHDSIASLHIPRRTIVGWNYQCFITARQDVWHSKGKTPPIPELGTKWAWLASSSAFSTPGSPITRQEAGCDPESVLWLQSGRHVHLTSSNKGSQWTHQKFSQKRVKKNTFSHILKSNKATKLCLFKYLTMFKCLSAEVTNRV